jgi:AcrR family transcriptional regulator
MNQKGKNDFPKERILNEAEILFAQKGYHAVSVREITNAAHCNLAAVNYHFGNKENLYLEVFRVRWVPRARRVIDCFDRTLASHGPLSQGAVIQALAYAFLEGPLSDEERQRHHLLMAREMAQPTGALKLVAEQIMGPFFQKLADKLHQFMPEDRGEKHLKLDVLSMFAVVFFFNFARVAVTRITGREYDSGFKAQLMEQIIQFSLKGLGGGEKGETL